MTISMTPMSSLVRFRGREHLEDKVIPFVLIILLTRFTYHIICHQFTVISFSSSFESHPPTVYTRMSPKSVSTVPLLWPSSLTPRRTDRSSFLGGLFRDPVLARPVHLCRSHRPFSMSPFSSSSTTLPSPCPEGNRNWLTLLSRSVQDSSLYCITSNGNCPRKTKRLPTSPLSDVVPFTVSSSMILRWSCHVHSLLFSNPLPPFVSVWPR